MPNPRDYYVQKNKKKGLIGNDASDVVNWEIGNKSIVARKARNNSKAGAYWGGTNPPNRYAGNTNKVDVSANARSATMESMGNGRVLRAKYEKRPARKLRLETVRAKHTGRRVK